ncbi:MAG TPA: FkbM family methyltransferase [Polyangiales bacterium]
MFALGSKVRRVKEARFIVGECAADRRSQAALMTCYASILRDVTDRKEVDFRISLSGRVFPFTMRRSDIFTLGEILHEQQYRLASYVPNNPTIIDAGANIGVTALWFLWQYPGATIHAFEPEPDNFRLLQANFGSHPQVVLNQAGLGAQVGRLQLHLGEHGAVHSFFGEGGRSLDVQVLTLADYVEKHQIACVDVLKLDVEGSELDVLKGLGEALSRVQVIVGEVHERVVDQRAFYEYLREHGFVVVRRIDFIDGEHEGVHGFEAVKQSARAVARP